MTDWRIPAVRHREQVQEVRAGRSYEVRMLLPPRS